MNAIVFQMPQMLTNINIWGYEGEELILKTVSWLKSEASKIEMKIDKF